MGFDEKCLFIQAYPIKEWDFENIVMVGFKLMSLRLQNYQCCIHWAKMIIGWQTELEHCPKICKTSF